MNTVYTIGHSTRSAEGFRELLAQHGIELLIDVRRFPGSRRYPHFGAEALANSLVQVAAQYVHEPALGGRRSGTEHSPNAHWRNASFRAFADYMATDDFRRAVDRLIDTAGQQVTAIMCAEAVPWRCHRHLISDALVSRGCEVIHLLGASRSDPHVLNSHAMVHPDGHIFYPAPERSQRELFHEGSS